MSGWIFRGFKYALYLLLVWNVVLFWREDAAASAETFAAGVSWWNLVQAYAATIDTLAWVVLLLLFELETAVIPDRYLQGRLKWVLSGLRGLCYLVIIYAFYGYWAKLGVVTDLEVFNGDPCALLGQGWTTVLSLDEYPPLDAVSCAALAAGGPVLQVAGTQILLDGEHATLLARLAWTDVINAGAWLLVVAALEVEVMLQLRGVLRDTGARLFAWGKGLLYAVLFLCAVYWGLDGDVLDFWDAFLWLVAFVFIELNIFQWRDESAEPAAAP